MDFKPINTQEEFDTAVSSLVEQKTQEITKKYEGYMSPDDASKFQNKITAYEASIADLTAKNAAYEKNFMKQKIAREMGIPYELAERLSGDTEDAIRADAETFSSFIKEKQEATPKASGEKPVKNAEAAAYSAMLHDLREE